MAAASRLLKAEVCGASRSQAVPWEEIAFRLRTAVPALHLGNNINCWLDGLIDLGISFCC